MLHGSILCDNIAERDFPFSSKFTAVIRVPLRTDTKNPLDPYSNKKIRTHCSGHLCSAELQRDADDHHHEQ